MSWGERSCKKKFNCDENCTMENCNVDCIGYEWDLKTKPDSSKSGAVCRIDKQFTPPGPNRAERRRLAKLNRRRKR